MRSSCGHRDVVERDLGGVRLERMPSFSSWRDTDTPGSDVSTMNSETPR